ncbi:DUF2953 domain-containing protein [Neobacillus sp. FSL H8-0543]|uniref:DUF2953 domain-containing protein n=1 Tax=Neobacillus sp. FSL H8-0543 TaxID=2954672 RepID=UPI003159081D
MSWLYIALFIFLFLLLIIIFTKLTIFINYYHHNDNDDLKIEFRVWGIIKYKLKIPLIKIDDNSPSLVIKGNTQMGEAPENQSETKAKKIVPEDVISYLKDAKEIIQHIVGMNVIVRKFMRKVTVKQFEWHSLIGVGDAALTGMISGAVWTLKGSIVGILSHYLRLKEMPNLSVTPHFQFAILQTHLTCIFQFRIGHAILAGLKLIKFWKGGRPNLNLKNSSNTKEQTKSV